MLNDVDTNTIDFLDLHEDLMQYLDRASSLVNFAMATRFSELDDAVMFRYFEVLSDILCQMKKSIKRA